MTPTKKFLFSRKELYHFLVSLCLFLTPALSLTVNSGYSYGTLILTILAVIFLLTSLYKDSPSLNRADKLLLFTLIIYFIIYTLSVTMDGMNLRDLERPSRFALAGLTLIFLLKTNFNPRFLLYGIMIGAFGAGILSLYQFFILDIHRPSGYHHSIAFGNDSQMLGLLSFVCAGYFLQKEKYALVICSVTAGMLALIAFILSGTRGGWLAAPLLILQHPNISSFDRLLLAKKNLILYAEGKAKTSSTGIRIEMWKSAWYSFLEKPIYGTGEHKNKEFKKKQVEKNLVHKYTLRFIHTHNDLLTALSFRGGIGFISLLAIYLVPLYLFRKKMNSQPSNKPYALSGMIICLSYFIYGLTQSMFEHNSGTTIYAFMVVFCWASIRQLEKIEALPKSQSKSD